MKMPVPAPATEASFETADAVAVNARANRSLYKKREKIYPKKAQGTFRRLKWIVMAATLAIYYLAPWLRWDRGAALPDQAILIDFPSRRFYFFFIEIWPDEVYFLTGLLILAAFGLFLITSLAGRVWCGYTCPQTVWTDLFIAVERLVEGDRASRIRLDKSSWTAAKATRKAVKHALWLAIAVATGGAWVFYFTDAPTLAAQLVSLEAPAVAYLWIGILTFTTYMLGGIAREQVCTYMCPWPRIQAALQDEESLVVSYHPARGEPRAPYRKNDDWEARGHCIDCNQCVAVCPMGIDIRDGQQLECISCALCIDACNGVMDKVGLPRGLIGYDTLTGMAARAQGAAPKVRLIRPRTLLYAISILVVSGIMLFVLLNRATLEIAIQHDRNPLFVTLSDGGVRNGYTLKIQNKAHGEGTYLLTAEGVAGAEITVVGLERTGAVPVLSVPPDQLRSYRVFVTAPAARERGETAPFAFVLTDASDGRVARYDSVFRGPKR